MPKAVAALLDERERTIDLLRDLMQPDDCPCCHGKGGKHAPDCLHHLLISE